ncbi:MAG TPA: 2,3-bisphosphoglycerate-independent phosphoglycerate mutase [Natrialbaceae archaeon]|nr:2,3-bisphosphoglycerate-independent phosphoglycerate mutase [Natrialbaceae archaeon]
MKAALIILDGWGLNDDPGDHRDAVAAADTPTFDRIAEAGAYGRLEVTGRRVGLPEGQMGNSEVGHLNIGAGRVVKQEYTRINDAIADGELATNEAIAGALEYADAHDGRVHFMGLVSDGGVHSAQAHLHGLIELAADRGVEAVTHAFTDGRDTPPKSGVGYLEELESVVEAHGTGDVATVTGRYYAMDRDRNWERTRRAYDAIVNREAEHGVATPTQAARESYERGDTDEFVEPTLIEGGDPLRDGDSVLFFNFRADRARQLVRMLGDVRPEWDFETEPHSIELVTMTEYDRSFAFPVAFPPHQPTNTLGEVVAAEGMTQLRIAESEKYAHVTYFLNGGREVEFDGEIREIIESPDVPTYDEQPEMSAPEVTDAAVEIIETDDPDVMVLNYANPDMVGHTGDFEAAVAAVEAVDAQLDRLLTACREAGAHVLVTADHGNADDMGTPEDPHTAHTYNDVPLVYLAPDGTDGHRRVREGGSLCDLSPTILSLIGVEQPEEMTGESLLE